MQRASPRTTNDQRPTTGSYAGVTRKLISTAVDDCVSAPTEMKSTPVSAYARTFSRLMPPAHSSGIRRRWRRTNLDRLAHMLDADMVEQDRLRAMVQRLLQFLQRPHFNFDRLPAAPVADRALQRRNRASSQRNVIALDQHAVGEIQPVILPAAAAHRVLVNHAQPRRRLARIENSHVRALDRIHKLAGGGRDSGHALQKIQDHPLTRQNHPRVMPDHRDLLPRVHADAIKNRRMARHLVMRSDRAVERGVDVENPRHAAEAGQNALLLGDNRRRSALVGIDAGVAGRIARRPIFVQRVLQNRGNAS